MRKSSRGNPWHDERGRFCSGPKSGKPYTISEKTKEEYEQRTKERFGETLSNMPTNVGQTEEDSMAFMEDCAKAFGVDTKGIGTISESWDTTVKKGDVKGTVSNGTFSVWNWYVDNIKNKDEQIHATYHETFHLARHNKQIDYDINSKECQDMEETQAEIAACTMSEENGIDAYSNAYSAEIVKIIPRLKNDEKYKECKTFSDFGKKFIERRKSDNVSLNEDVEIASRPFDECEYYTKYADKWKEHLDEIRAITTHPSGRFYYWVHEEEGRKRIEESAARQKMTPEEYQNDLLSSLCENGFASIKNGTRIDELREPTKGVVEVAIRRIMEKDGVL